MNELMNQLLTITRQTTPNKYSEYTTTSVSVYGRLEMKQKLIQATNGNYQGTNGNMIVSEGVIYSSSIIYTGDKITYDSIEYKIENVYTVKDLMGNIRHYKGYLV